MWARDASDSPEVNTQFYYLYGRRQVFDWTDRAGFVGRFRATLPFRFRFPPADLPITIMINVSQTELACERSPIARSL